jgi:uncharacterized membrane protein (UPF0182 family)
VVLAVGNRLIYTDTYEQALADLSNGSQSAHQTTDTSTSAAGPPAAPAPTGAPPPTADPRIQRIREHLERYRQLAAQGHWAEAGKELEAVEAEAKK